MGQQLMNEATMVELAAEPGLITPASVAWRFEQVGLAPPPIPEALAPALRIFGDWTFATIDPPAAPYDLASYLDRLDDDGAEDYLLIAHDGYGMNNWALHYFLVNGPLMCFLQLPWGGVETDEAAAAERIAAAFSHVETLCAAPMPENESLTVIDAFDIQFWTLSRQGADPVTHGAFDPLADSVRHYAVTNPAADAGPTFV